MVISIFCNWCCIRRLHCIGGAIVKTASCKAKGRRLLQEVRDKVLKWFPDLKPDDIRVTPSGCTGEDLLLSPAAQNVFPFIIEGKNQEALNVWAALSQAESHKQNGSSLMPLLVFRRNRSPIYCALSFDDFLSLVGVFNQEVLIMNEDGPQSESEVN